MKYVAILKDEHGDIKVISTDRDYATKALAYDLMDKGEYTDVFFYDVNEPPAYTIICNMSSECAEILEYASTLEEALAIHQHFQQQDSLNYNGTYIRKFSSKEALKAYITGLEDANGWAGEPVYLTSIVDQNI